MPQQDYVKEQKIFKIIQLVILVIIEITFILILLLCPELKSRIYSNPALFTICTVTWVLMIFSFLCLLFDFYRLRSLAVAKHALSKAAYLDTLTGIPNRYSCDLIFQSYADDDNLGQVGCVMIELSNLQHINDTLGHATGDALIRDFCELYEQVGDQYGFVARNGGNEFITVISDCTDSKVTVFINKLKECFADYNLSHSQAPIEINYASMLNTDANVDRINDLITLTYKKLHDTERTL